jgi:hypothetical protein
MGKDNDDLGAIIGRRSIDKPKPPPRKPGRTWDLKRGGYERAMRLERTANIKPDQFGY